MKKLALLFLLILPYFVQSQSVSGDELRIYGKASIGEDGSVQLDMNGNPVKNVLDPVDDQDVVTKKYLEDNVVVGDVPFVDFQVNEDNPVYKQARLWYDYLRAEMVFFDRVENLEFRTVGELSIRVINNSGSTINKGKAVYPTGSSGGFTTIDLALSSDYEKSRPVGFAKNTILNGEEGWVMLRGVLDSINTSLLSGGKIYLSPTEAGGVTNTLPSNGNFIILMGAVGVVDAISGVINVDPYINEYTAETISPRGWASTSNSIVTLNPITRTVTVDPTGDTDYIYEDGVKYEFGTVSETWADIEGTFDIYFDKGELKIEHNRTTSQVREIYSTKAGIGRHYWDAQNDSIVFANDMQHTFDMNGNTWATFWDLHKCTVLEGINITNISTGGTGNVNADAQFGNGAGIIRNQDIITSVPAVASTIGYDVFYRTGVSNWRLENVIGFPVFTTGTGRLAYNQNVGGVWQLTECTNGYYTLCHLFTSNTRSQYRTGVVMGQSQYATITAARTGAVTEIKNLVFSQFPIKELAPVATIIYETRDNYTNLVNARTVQSLDQSGNLVDFIDWRFSGVSGSGAGGAGGGSFLDDYDTPTVYTSSAGKGVVVNSTPDGLIFDNVVTSVNGVDLASPNYNIVLTANKVGENVTVGTGGTGTSAVVNVADNDNNSLNELQSLNNSKLNNSINLTISGGTGTTVTNIARTDFANTFTTNQTISGNLTVNGTGAVKVASGTTAQRPTPVNGQIRYDTDLSKIQTYENSAWKNFVTSTDQTNLSNYPKKNGIETISAQWTYTTSPLVPSATLREQAANLGNIWDAEMGLSWQGIVINFFNPTGGLPTTPNDGDRYISTATANGWIINNIYEWKDNDLVWIEAVSLNGFAAFVNNLATFYNYNGSNWIDFSVSPTVHATTHQNNGADEINVAGLSGVLADNQPTNRNLDWTGTFDGQEGSYYLNYANLTNKPTILTMVNGVDNRIVTSTSATGLNGESGMTYNGSTFAVNGDISCDQELKLTNAFLPLLSFNDGSGVSWNLSHSSNSFKIEYGLETSIKAIEDGGTELYYNNLKKAETTSTGLAVTGIQKLESGGIDGILADNILFAPTGFATTVNHRMRSSHSIVRNSNYLNIETSTGTTGVYNNNQLVLRGNGFIGIGVLSPSVALDVSGAITATGNISMNQSLNSGLLIGNTSAANKWLIGSRNAIDAGSDNDLALYSRDGHVTLWDDGAVNLATTSAGIAVTGTITATGDITSTSDIRKKNLKYYLNNNYLPHIISLSPIAYTMKDTTLSEKTNFGFSAQEVQASFPEWVHEDGEGWLSLDYGKMGAVLAVQGIKELNTKLEKENKQLRDDIKSLQESVKMINQLITSKELDTLIFKTKKQQ